MTVVEALREWLKEFAAPGLAKRIAQVERAVEERRFLAEFKGHVRAWRSSWTTGNAVVSREFIANAKSSFQSIVARLPKLKMLAKWVKVAGEVKAVPYVGLGCTVLQILFDDEYEMGYAFPDLLFGLIGFVPVGGWFIECVWFLSLRPMLEALGDSLRNGRRLQDSPLKRPKRLPEIPATTCVFGRPPNA